MPNPYEIVAVRVTDCEHCGAPVGQPCKNERGRVSLGCHWKRKDALQRWRRSGHLKDYADLMCELKLGPEYGLSGC